MTPPLQAVRKSDREPHGIRRAGNDLLHCPQMPTTRIAPDLEMHYLVDDYTDPWRDPETILLLHGNCESGAA